MKKASSPANARRVLIAAAFVLATGCGRVEPEGQGPDASGAATPPSDAARANGVDAPAPVAEPTAVGTPRTTPSGLTYETLKAGEGPSARRGDKASIHFTSTLSDGKPVDSTRDKEAPLTFPLGEAAVIMGLDEGVTGMQVGETRKLTVPPNLGYGALGRLPEVPPNSSLVFEIELMGVEAK